MKHRMKLHDAPYNMIENGSKTIELRLYDEKRRSISVGDEIEFIHSIIQERSLLCRVTALHIFPSFEELYRDLPLSRCGYTESDISTASPDDMDVYYSKEQQKKYGVVGIEIELLSERSNMKNYKISDLLSKSSSLTAKHADLFHVPYPSEDMGGFQGGCSDGGRYYYLILMHYEKNDRSKDYSRIAKIDIERKTVVKYSDILHLDHGNDMTYHPEKNLLLVANNKPDPTRITLIDPESLEVVGYEEAPLPIYAIEYIREKDIYAVGMSGTRSFCFLDGNLKLIDGSTYRMDQSTDRYTKQGLYADGSYVYFILWDGKHQNMDDFQNIISIYDHSGNFKGVLEFNVGVQEPENLSVANGEILAVCGPEEGEPIIYRFEPRIK